MTRWTFVLVAIIALFIIFWPKPEKTGYQIYQNSKYGFSIKYPQAWEIKTTTHVFENGDAVAFRKKGPTQKENTELTDGAQVAISKPFVITTDLTLWVKENFSNQAKFSRMTLTKYPYEAVEDCSNLGCMRYYFISVNDKVFGVAVFTEGPNEEKMVYENATLYMLKSLTFDNITRATVLKEEAVTKVKALPEVVDYLKQVPNGIVLVNGEEGNFYMVQVYEFKNGNTATFNWYKVDKTTGIVEKQF